MSCLCPELSHHICTNYRAFSLKLMDASPGISPTFSPNLKGYDPSPRYILHRYPAANSRSLTILPPHQSSHDPSHQLRHSPKRPSLCAGAIETATEAGKFTKRTVPVPHASSHRSTLAVSGSVCSHTAAFIFPSLRILLHSRDFRIANAPPSAITVPVTVCPRHGALAQRASLTRRPSLPTSPPQLSSDHHPREYIPAERQTIPSTFRPSAWLTRLQRCPYRCYAAVATAPSAISPQHLPPARDR